MRFQTRKSSCGSASLANALEAKGIKRTEDELGELCKQTAEGTTPPNLRRAVELVEGVNKEINETRADVALLYVLEALYEGHPVILCVDNWTHWAVAGGILGLGKRIVCIDSGDNDLVVVRGLEQFLDWWRGPENAKKPFYGVIV